MIITLILLIGIIIIYVLNIKGFVYLIIYLIICLIGYLCLVTFRSTGSDDSECLSSGHKKVNGVFAGEGCIDVWHVRHVLMWITIGLIYPNHYIMAFVISLAFELAEHWFYSLDDTNPIGRLYTKNRCFDTFCGRYEDVILNMIGYSIGSILIR